ncbi:uncharacterized protein PHACADRAFT_213152 [Phanerochaete carnosa HHB-10118-sp]|uniref:Uncharacterized protein n=1 Tax=Phanerochaete carnosa (strain HHB-10118-sp) TaxID=650164 RepID=K5WM18_PHACS|nr:uncharacterized protein PHACADRAFT_213152 [Phanerochaete carnosa HHB-10118-sp]EKM51302.1 hypothetical protein PHACADRAFT_213152 [Phanerochaete carnosa HHB-10118-sp]
MDNSTGCTNFFTQNTDITGIGVRVAFYLQVTIVVFQIRLREEEGMNAFWTLASMSFGLMLATVVSAAQHQLSFFNAYQVQNLVCLANCALVQVAHAQWRITLSNPYREQKIRDRMFTWFYYIQYILAGSLLVTLWAIGEKFGPDSSCISSMHFYVAYWRIFSSNAFHGAKIAAFVIYVWLILIGVLGVLLLRLWLRGLIDRAEANGFDRTRDMPTEAELAEYRTRSPKHRPWKVQSWIHYFIYWFLAMSFYIPPIELSLRQNSQPTSANAQWSFGQILSLVAIAPSVVAFFLTIGDFKAERGALRAVVAKARKSLKADDAERATTAEGALA